jgi:hypothetical protein
MRPINAYFPAHHLVVIQISNSGSSGVRVGEVCESITLGLPGVRIDHQSKLCNGAGRTENILDLLFRKVWETVREALAAQTKRAEELTVWDIPKEHTLAGAIWSHNCKERAEN